MYKNLLTKILLLLIAFPLNAQVIKTIFGNIEEKNPVILELIASPTMQRLKHIDQSGPQAYFIENYPTFSRYDHSLGVYALLKKFEVSNNEQIAGLVHDASHTVFSHLADVIFQSGDSRQDSYQDSIHDWFLQQMHIDSLISKYNLKLIDISPKNPKFTALEQSYPDMNADRIEYNLHTALVFQDLDNQDIAKILQSLNYSNQKWYFDDIQQAKKFAKLSTYYTKCLWGDSHNIAIYTVAGAALKYALEQKIINNDNLHFGIDEQLVEVLNKSTDPILKQLVAMIKNINQYYQIADKSNYHIYQPIKMRGIDPLVMQNNKLYRLSNLSLDFKNELELTQRQADAGVYLKFINIPDKNIMELLKKSNV